ncbi:Hypothetical_protein [Hexamita inflata]|uniref:Hypothetical_protein n=1 Tax=Hexamita inflata TaxID=28002 RepID=A0AA86UZ87_9EUKA|nr:Hypothetical protein HINF_LOCUS65730 [Hexamita inflata]
MYKQMTKGNFYQISGCCEKSQIILKTFQTNLFKTNSDSDLNNSIFRSKTSDSSYFSDNFEVRENHQTSKINEHLLNQVANQYLNSTSKQELDSLLNENKREIKELAQKLLKLSEKCAKIENGILVGENNLQIMKTRVECRKENAVKGFWKQLKVKFQ